MSVIELFSLLQKIAEARIKTPFGWADPRKTMKQARILHKFF